MEYRNLPIIVLGAGPAGMATALALLKAGHKVLIFERYPRARAAGSILSLLPPPIKALEAMGVDVKDLGSPCDSHFRNAAGKIRTSLRLPAHVMERYGGGFLGLLRPDLYSRMIDALPEGTIQFNRHVERIEDVGDHVVLTMGDDTVVHTPLLIGADGIDSMVRASLWGSQPKRLHNLHVIGGFTFESCPLATPNWVEIHHGTNTQGTWSSITSKGKQGYQWWFVEPWSESTPPPADLKTHCLSLAPTFPPALTQLVGSTKQDNMVRWPIRDRKPISQWSRGRVTLAGDAAHATSPYASYGAGMSICDGYYLGQLLHNVDLGDLRAIETALQAYDAKRIPHTSEQVNQAYILGQIFHHTPWPLTVLRDLFFDYTPFLQRVVGDRFATEIMARLEEMGDGIVVTS